METKQRLITVMLALVAMFMGVLRVNAISPNGGVVIAEKDYTGGFEGDYPNWYMFGEGQDGSISSDPDGVAINVGSKTGQLWDPQVMLINEEIQLKRGGNYKVVVTAKFPCDGQLQINMGSWAAANEHAANEQYIVDVVSTSDFQEVEINFPEYPYDCTNSGGVGEAHVLFMCGDFLGATIVKKVQVWDLDAEAYAVLSDDGKTLTFRYDSSKSTYGSAYYLNEGNNLPGWNGITTIETVVFDETFKNARPTSTFEWFGSFSKLTEFVGMEYLNTSEVTTMEAMFGGCKSITNLDLSHFNTSKVTNMQSMFVACEKLKEINLRGFDTSKVTSMQLMFKGCVVLETLNLGSFNTSNVTNMQMMFDNCSMLKTIYVGGGWSVANAGCFGMFTECKKLTGGQGTTYDAEHTAADYAHIDGGESDPGYLSLPPEAYALYSQRSDGVYILTFYYDNLRNTASRIGIKKYDLNEGSNMPGWISDNRMIEKVVFDSSFKDARPTSTYNWFAVKDYLGTFVGLEYLNTSEVTNMSQMFMNCSGLTSIDLSGLDTKNVTDMSQMFNGCIDLTSVNLSGLNTQNVTNMNRMFFGCNSLTSVNLSGLNTSNLQSASFMFSGCKSLTSLNLSSFDTSNVHYMNSMFNACNELKTITVGVNWNTANVESSDYMFSGCTSIVGGAGTTYNSGKVDKEYAIADGLNGNPGYLTAVSYGITVSGRAVTFANKYDVLGNETVNYDDALNTLTLINADVSSINIASTAPNDLLIKVNGECEVKNELGNAFTSDIANLTIEGPGKLTIGSTRRIGIKLGHNAGLIVDDVDLIVSGSTGIEGSYIGATYKCHLGFFNANCTVTSKAASSPSVNYIFSLKLKDCKMTSGTFDSQNHLVIGNPMIIQRSVGISTDINAIDNGQLTIDKSLPLYNLNGQRVSHPVKGQIYIQNGRKIKF